MLTKPFISNNMKMNPYHYRYLAMLFLNRKHPESQKAYSISRDTGKKKQ